MLKSFPFTLQVHLFLLIQFKAYFQTINSKMSYETNATIVTACSCFSDNELRHVLYESVLVQLNFKKLFSRGRGMLLT